MESKIRLDGIYDHRTLKHLKLLGVKDFCFDFSPTSFNFIQEHIFLDLLTKVLDSFDRVFLHFSRSNDPMIFKLAADIKKCGYSLNNVFFEIDEWKSDYLPTSFPYQYVLNYSNEIDLAKMIGANFSGFIFQSNFFELLHRNNLIINFANNFFTRFHSTLMNHQFLILKIDWHTNLLTTLLNLFDFNLISLPINSNIEICYRNVDLKKLTNEMDLFKKNTEKFIDFY